MKKKEAALGRYNKVQCMRYVTNGTSGEENRAILRLGGKPVCGRA